MGCSQSNTQAQQNRQIKNGPRPPTKTILTMIGSNVKGSQILNFQEQSIQSVRCSVLLPRYAHAILQSQRWGYLTGGIQQIQASMGQNVSFEDRLYEGIISKKCYKVDIFKLATNPDSAFEEIPEMTNARYAHCAIFLKQKLYVLGGRQYGNDELGLLSACQKYDEKEKRWDKVPPLQNPRTGAAAIIFGEHIYIFGGYTGNFNRSRDIESFSQGDNAWRKVPFQLHMGLQGLTVLKGLSQSSILIFGGKTDYGKSKQVTEINFATSSIGYHKSMSQARSFMKAIKNKKFIYLVGGGPDSVELYDPTQGISQIDKDISYLEHVSAKDINSFSQFQYQINLSYKKKSNQNYSFKNKVYIYGHAKQPFCKIIDTDKLIIYSENQSLHHNFYQFQTCIRVNKQHSFIMGGINSDCTQVTNKAYSINISSQQIKYLEPMKIARYGFPAVVKGSYLYVIGGRKLGGDDVAIMSQCQRFSFETYQWESIAPLKYKRHSALAIAYGKFVFAIGGYKGNGVRSNEIEVYIEQENKWVQLQQKFELAVQSMTPVLFADQIYLFGGRAQSIDIQKIFKLNISIEEGTKLQKAIRTQLEPMGNLAKPGTNLKVFVNDKGMAYIFGNIQGGIDIYDLKEHQIQPSAKLSVFLQLKDPFFQPYTIAF